MRAERAEISPPKLVASPQRNGHLPRWANPVLTARLTLATLTGLGAAVGVDFVGKPTNPSTVDAAEICRIQVAFHVFTGIDMFPINGLGRPGKIDNTEDPKVGPGVNLIGESLAAEVMDARRNIIGVAQIFRRSIPADLRERILTSQFDRGNPNLTEEGYGETNIIETACNRPGRQVQVLVRTSQNPKDQEPRIIKHGQKLHEFVGKQIETADGIRKASQFLLPTDPRRKQIEEGLKDPEVVKRIDAEANRKRQERGESTLTPTPQAATRPTVAASATYTEEVRAALEKAMTELLDKATRDLQEDLRRQAQTTNTSLGNLNTTLQKQEQRAQELERIILDLKTVISLTVQATAAPTSTVPSGGVLEEIGKLSGRLPVKEVWPWALGILAALGSILGYRSWMPATYNIRGRGIPVHLNIRGRKII